MEILTRQPTVKGPAPGHFITHIAMWEGPEEGPESEWGDLVTDEEYGQR